jgi:hypothetical protein
VEWVGLNNNEIGDEINQVDGAPDDDGWLLNSVTDDGMDGLVDCFFNELAIFDEFVGEKMGGMEENEEGNETIEL